MSNIFIIVGPSGVGKTAATSQILAKYCDKIVRPPSYTTRDPRAGEVEGYDYHFISRDVMARKFLRKDFIAYDNVYDCAYGTDRAEVMAILSYKRKVLLIMNPAGADQVVEAGLGPVLISLLPPSIEELQKRLIARGANNMNERMVAAEQEIGYSRKCHYTIVNTYIDNTIKELVTLFNL